MFIEDKIYKIYYFMIVALGTLTFINIWLTVTYYIKLRNDPGIPGPRGKSGDKGPSGTKGKCTIGESCAFTKTDASKILYKVAADKFDTSQSCLKQPTLKNCNGGIKEVDRVKSVSTQIKMLEELAGKGTYTKQEFEAKVNSAFDGI